MIIVTGAAGFIGSAFVWELNQRGLTNIVCVDQWDDKEKWKNLCKRKIQDVMDLHTFRDLLQTKADPFLKNVKAVIHMGACSTTTETDVDYLLDNNYRYSQEIFLWCQAQKIPLIYASSCATYGKGEQGFDDSLDSYLLQPLNPYGYSKVLFDRWALDQMKSPNNRAGKKKKSSKSKDQFPWYGLRFSNVYGPNEYHKNDQSSVALKAFHQFKETGQLKLFKSFVPQFKDGEQMRDFIYIKDVTFWMGDLLEQILSKKKTAASGVYNFGSGKARTWLDLAKAVSKSADVPFKIEWINAPENIRKQYQNFTEATMERWYKAGFQKPKFSLESGISDYVKNYLLQEDPYL